MANAFAVSDRQSMEAVLLALYYRSRLYRIERRYVPRQAILVHYMDTIRGVHGTRSDVYWNSSVSLGQVRNRSLVEVSAALSEEEVMING
jgi:hypothetical protein